MQAILAKLDAIGAGLGDKTHGARDWHAQLKPPGPGDEQVGLVDDIFQVRALRRDGAIQESVVYLDGSAACV